MAHIVSCKEEYSRFRMREARWSYAPLAFSQRSLIVVLLQAGESHLWATHL
jgi:hypothetical protein